MSCYLRKKVLGVTESIRIVPHKNAIFLVLKWIWGILGCWLFLVPLIRAIVATIKFCHTEYLITDRNVMEKYNVFNTYTNQMPLAKVENVVVNYTFWGKIFNYGNVIFSGSNRTPVVFICVRDAEKIKRQVNSLILP